MKRYAASFVIAVLAVALASSLVTRERSKHEAPAAIATVDEMPAADAGADASELARAVDAGAAAIPLEAGAPKDEAPLRVTTLGWELVAAGAALASPQGTSSMELAPESSLAAIEARLARGGADPQGADVAVLPLPSFVASFERLRALEPTVFLVVGFSRGREEVRAAARALLEAPPAGGEVRLVALDATTMADASARAVGSESATLLGLFALDLVGVPPTRIQMVAPGSPEAKAASFAALIKGAPDPRPRAFSTADASRLVPIVAVAPKALLDARESAVRDWSRAWIDGLSRTKSDVPGVARRLAAKEALPLAASVGAAPEALVLVERLGQIEDVGLDPQASLIGPLANGAVTLESLMHRTWQLARAAGITAVAAPSPLPIDARIVATIAPPKMAPQTSEARAEGEGDAGVRFGPLPAGAVAQLAYRAVDGDAAQVANEIVFLAGVFERGVFKISVKGGDKAARAIAQDAHQRGVAAARLATMTVEPSGAFAVVYVLSPP